MKMKNEERDKGEGIREDRKMRATMKLRATFFSLFPIPFYLKYTFAALFFVAAFIFVGCDLFTTPADPDYLDKIKEEVRWANANKLIVRLDYIQEWGGSNPIRGQISTGVVGSLPIDIREGYEFSLEFTPMSGYGFVEWLAFRSEPSEPDLNDQYEASILTGALEAAKSHPAFLASETDEGVVSITRGITETGAITASVTINANIRITLVPWCDNRPQIIRSNPPLVPAINSFPYDQRISLWFNMDIAPDSVILGDTVIITAVETTGANSGEPFGADGDISGFFKVSDYIADQYRLDLSVKNEGEYPANLLQLLGITVTVNGITSASDIAMTQAQSVSYTTNAGQAQKVYEAYNIQARRKESGNEKDTAWFSDFGTQWNNPEIDRRFNNTSAGEYNYNTVYLRFTVTNPEGITQLPNRIIVTPVYANYLNGIIATGQETDIVHSNETPSGDNYYYITYTVDTNFQGIMRLLIRPWYEDAENPVAAQEINDAISTGQYVSIVIDTDAPALHDLGAEITGGTEPVNGVYTFPTGGKMTLTLGNLDKLADNGTQGGIHSSAAWNRPWTMDDRSGLKWRVTVGALDPSGWISAGTDNCEQPLTGLQQGIEHNVNVQFIDTMGNISAPVSAGRIRVIAGAPVAVENLTAKVDETGTLITIEWTTPQNAEENMTGARVYVNGSLHATVNGTGAKSSTLTVLKLNADGVTSGNPVTGINRYDISVYGYNDAGNASAETLSVWNVPEMEVSSGQGTVIINEQLTMNN